MAYSFSDHFYVTQLSSGITSSATTIQVDTLTAEFADEVQNGGEFPLRIGRGSAQERVLVTGIADEANNKITVERGVEYGASSHNAGARVAHAMPAETADVASAKEVALPEPWEPSDFLAADDSVAPTVDQVLTHYPWESIAGISKIPRFLLDFTRIEKTPNALQRNHVRSSKATRWDSNGDLVEDSSGTLRLQRDPATQKVLGLLYEPKRAQLLSAPTDPSAFPDSDGVTFPSTGSAKGQTYTLMQDDGTTAAHLIGETYGKQGDGTPVSNSIICKNDNGVPWVGIGAFYTGNNSGSKYAWYKTDGSTTTQDSLTNLTFIDVSIDDLGGGWYRFNLTAKPDAGHEIDRTNFLLAKNSGDRTYNGDSSALRVLHTQAEVSREVTTPILQGGGVREADEVDYSFGYPDLTSTSAYSIKQEAGGNWDPFGKWTVSYINLDNGNTNFYHGAFGYNNGLIDAGGPDFKTDGWKKVAQTTQQVENYDSNGSQFIDRFRVEQSNNSGGKGAVLIVRQIANWPQTLTSQQKSDLKSKYLTQP